MVYIKRVLMGVLVVFILTSTILPTEAKSVTPVIQTSYIGSSTTTEFELCDETLCLMVIDNNLPYHYCTALPDVSDAQVAQGNATYDNSFASFQCVLNADAGIGSFSTILTSIENTKNLQSLYIELDPLTISDLDYEVFTSYMDRHPELQIVFCLPFHSSAYWNNLVTEHSFLSSVATYRNFSKFMLSYSQVTVLFPNTDYWMISNKQCFDQDEFYSFETATFLATNICKGKYKVNLQRCNSLYSEFAANITFQLTQHYPDLSGKNIAIFGDSINGSFDPLFSISTYMNGLTGANVYNFSIGGASAYSNPGDSNYSICLYEQVIAVLTKDFSRLDNNCKYFSSYVNSDENLDYDIIILEFGLNDYFNNYLIEKDGDPYAETTTKGGYRKSIELLQKRYPNAVIYITLPTHINFFDHGMTQYNNNGTLDDYVNAMRAIAEEYSLPIIDCYSLTGWGDDDSLSIYSLDGVHPNERGRYELALQYILSLEKKEWEK